MNLTLLLNKLTQKRNLTEIEIRFFIGKIATGEIDPVQIGAILTAFSMKGETVDEVVSFIKVFQEHMIPLYLSEAIDICGTGGDGKGTFNISTAAALVVASCGIKVAKHGNRAASSQCGSADVLEALGVNISLTAEQASAVFKRIGMIFLFAPVYHPIMKLLSPIRKSLQIRTIFNYIGPFLNPARTKRQLIGVPTIEIAKKLSEVAQRLNFTHLLIASGEDGLDEVSIASKTVVYEIKKNTIKKMIINPAEYGFNKSSKKNILGSNTLSNAKIIQDILDGEKGPKRDVVVLNSAVALYVSGRVSDIREGIALSELSIDRGLGKKILSKLIFETQKICITY